MTEITDEVHVHPLLFLGNMEGPHGGNYPLYWCRDCGSVFEMFGENVASLHPEWVREKVEASKIRFEAERPQPKKVQQRVLGKSLVELMAEGEKRPSTGRGLDALFGKVGKDGG